MALTTPIVPESYQVTASLTAANVATALTDAMVDAGFTLHDTLLSGSVENRVFSHVYDGAKTYGTTYYWFMVTTSGIFAQAVSGWNTTTKQPSGTQYMDFFNTATNTTANHLTLISLNSSLSFTIKRWTSVKDTTFTWFVMYNGSTVVDFHINKTAPNVMYNLDKVFYHSMMWCQLQASGNAASPRFRLFPFNARRSFLGSSLRGITNGTYYAAASTSPWPGVGQTENVLNGPSYHMPGNINDVGTNLNYSGSGVALPYNFNNVNSGFTTDETPLIWGVPLNLYSPGVIPEDFGLVGYYTANTMDLPSTFRIPGSPDLRWDILKLTNSSGSVPGSASPLWLAWIE
jgi:hypothetical protein